MAEPSSIWRTTPDAASLNAFLDDSLASHLEIRITEVGADFLTATMPVDARTRQPFGILHGGASVVLSETLGSVAAYLTVDPATESAVGIEVNANHVRAARSGWVVGTVRPLHVGRRTQVWQTHITDETGRLICVSRLTVAIVESL
ncbi:MAG: hotdog fold thioesterase [Bacteroidota bacterium]